MYRHEFYCGGQEAFVPHGASRSVRVSAFALVRSGTETSWTERVRVKLFETSGVRLAQVCAGILRPVAGTARMPVCGPYHAGEVI